jgi:hypothetical protein
MTNTNLLKKKIDESGYKLRFIASKLGITYQGFLKKINNETEFKASEMQILRELLNLMDSEFEQIFFYLKRGIKFHKI